MAYDRYVAICQPLHYHIIINKKICALLLGGTWISGCVNSILYTVFASNVSLCHDNPIDNYYCDSKALVKMICANPIYLFITHVEIVVFGLFPFSLSLISYIKIISSILSLRSKESRRKAFSTCTSHLTVLVIFYGSIICVYMKSSSEHTSVLDQVFSVLYTAVTPMLNPLIYSLKNKEVKNALKRILTQTQTGQTLFFRK
ncbi:olfactory receptor 2K2-like [Discoglossus pictus]